MRVSPKTNRLFCILLILAASVTMHATAASVLPFYESVPSTYVENGNIGAVPMATIWDFGNSVSSSSGRTTAAAALAYPGLITEDITVSRGMRSNPTGTGTKDRGASLTLTAGQTVYASFLLNVQSNYPGTTPFFGFSTSSTGTSVSKNGAAVFVDAINRLHISKNSGTAAAATTYSLTTNTTHFVVLRYKFNTGSTNDDSVDLWIDPTSFGNDNTVPAPSISTTANIDVSALGSIAYFQTAPIGLLYLDEIRVATNWAGVTPPTNSPGQTFAVTGGGLICSGGSIPVGLTGSELGVDYWLFTNGVYTTTTMPGTGSAISFGAQTNTALYTVLASNTVSGFPGWMSGGASVTFLNGAAIATQPTPAIAVSGSVVAFTVGATGDGLVYNWRRNGTNLIDGGNISGSTTSNLVIFPVGASDVATSLNGYDVVVTNICGNIVTSARVSLALDSAANLTWSGDGISNLWDAGISTNWNVNTAVFNFGDNVTFDDSSVNTTVTLNNSYLSIGKALVNATADHTLGGSGSIVGPGSLAKSGTGTVTISTVNSFTGGTVISNGVIALGSNGANSSGANSGLGVTNTSVTFYGGRLNLFGYNGSTSPNYNTFRNPLIVPTGQTGTLGMFSRGPLNTGANSGLASSLTGGGTLNLVVNYLRDNLDGDWSAFTGVINVTAKPSGNGDEMRINNSFGYSNAAIVLNDGVLMDRVTTANSTNDIGELSGTSLAVVGLGNTSAANPTWRVGWRNTTATFAGTINDDGITSIIKVGSGKWILTGANGYSGSTIVSNGVLALGDGVTDGSINNSTQIVLNAGTILDLSGLSSQTISLSSLQTLQGSGTVVGSLDTSLGGNVNPGLPTGILTVTNTATLGGTTTMSVKSGAASRLTATNIVYGGTLVVQLVGGNLHVNDTFDLFDWSGSLTGTFSSTVLPANYYSWDTSQLSVNGTIRVTAVTLPRITSFTLDLAGNLAVNGTNGAAGMDYSILSSTNLTAPLSSWTTVGTGTFLGDGTFNFNALIDRTPPHTFFILATQP
jgi:autotransporter-associated beta strand protein